MTYEELGIDPSKLKRDYIKNPLQRNVKVQARICYEYPEYEDLCYLYYEVNLSKVQMCKFFNIPSGSLRRCLEHFKMNKLKAGCLYKKEKTIIPPYDQHKLTRNYQIDPLIFKKEGKNWIREIPNLDDFKYLYINCNFGPYDLAQFFNVPKSFIHTLTPNFTKTKEAMYKTMQKTFIRRYAADNPMRSTVIKEKVCNTNLKKYGTNWQTQSNNFKEKAAKTNIKRYGKENYAQTIDWREKTEQTNKRRYGKAWHMLRPEYESIKRNTCLKKYGVDNVSKTKEVISKIYAIKIKNHTYSTSKPEKEIKQLLENKFKDVKYQYKSEEYPFNCDFYIPELKLYIEYQGNWTHGKHCKKIYGPYNKNKADHKKLLSMWEEKAKTSKFYAQAINVWTIRDPLKRETAKKNNLNWIEFFTIEEFNTWLMQFQSIDNSKS